jgi:hypothetical protein
LWQASGCKKKNKGQKVQRKSEGRTMRTKTVALACIVLITSGIALGKYSGGTGEPNDPYRIAAPNDLNDIGNHIEDFNKGFVMVNDINLAEYTGTQFNIIGSDSNAFVGVFDGNGHTVSNFTYNSTGTDGIGLFRYVDDPNAQIKNLGLIGPNVDAGTGDFVGSLVGRLDSGSITDCNSVGAGVAGGYYVGGLVGYNANGTVNNSYATGHVNGTWDLVGGLVGHSDGGTVSNSYSTGSVSGYYYVGGLIGAHDAAVSNSYSTANVSGYYFVGGLVGWNQGPGTVSDSYATGSVSGDGGILGFGGLVGANYSTVSNSYSVGDVNGVTYVGGLVGYSYGTSHYTRSFWDNTVNSGLNGIGNGSDPNVIGQSTANMHKRETFSNAGWDFVEVWGIGQNQTYPFLRKYLAGDANHDGIVNFYDYAIMALYWMNGDWPVGID